jgi:4-amino-4-deoxy-L-arabinose transferase-like glycosyltransferase
VYRPPGLPGLLFLVYWLTGPTVAHAIVVQQLATVATIPAVFWLALRLGCSQRMALCAAGLLAVDPVSIFHASLLLTESYTALIMVSVLILAQRCVATGSWQALVLIGPLLGVGTLIHPVLLLAPLAVLALPWFAPDTRRLRWVAPSALVALLALAPAACWIVRNDVVASFREVSCVSAVNLMKYKAAGVLAAVHGTTRDVERDRLTSECESRLPHGAAPGLRWREWERRGWEVVCAHPALYGWLHVKGCAVELLGVERDHLAQLAYGADAVGTDGRITDDSLRAERGSHPRAWVELLRERLPLYQIALMVLVLIGIARLVRGRRWAGLLLLLVPVIYVLFLSGGPEADPRFRVIYAPLLCILAAQGLTRLAGRTHEARQQA